MTEPGTRDPSLTRADPLGSMTALGRRPTVVCVTPVRNEGWTLDRFLRCAEQWADHIVIADQGSSDDTRAIAEQFTKTVVVSNDSQGYDEGQRHRVVLEAARAVPGPRAILAVDADEALSANVLDSPEWERALRSDPGTVLTAEWINYLPGGREVWIPKRALPMGFIDDDRSHSPGHFHVERIMVRHADTQLSLDPVKLLHFQYLDWWRMKSKQRRYQCAETLHNRRKRPIQFYRQYHRMDAVPRADVRPVDAPWIAGYEWAGIDVMGVQDQGYYPTDFEVLSMLLEHGTRRFRRLDIWDVDWEAVARASGEVDRIVDLSDPRTPPDRAVHRWLAMTQRRNPERWSTRFLQRALIPFGW